MGRADETGSEDAKPAPVQPPIAETVDEPPSAPIPPSLEVRFSELMAGPVEADEDGWVYFYCGEPEEKLGPAPRDQTE
jgi:hypothetical protein